MLILSQLSLFQFKPKGRFKSSWRQKKNYLGGIDLHNRTCQTPVAKKLLDWWRTIDMQSHQLPPCPVRESQEGWGGNSDTEGHASPGACAGPCASPSTSGLEHRPTDSLCLSFSIWTTWEAGTIYWSLRLFNRSPCMIPSLSFLFLSPFFFFSNFFCFDKVLKKIK